MAKPPARQRFGTGQTRAARSRSVFINCPYDAAYRPLMDAIVFACICCGFLPRSALESGDVSVARLARIDDAMTGSAYSIHDLSRCKGEGDENLARFNMPIELGMAIGAAAGDLGHDWMALVPEDHPYARFASDLGGFDLIRHSATEPSVTRQVMAWLATRPAARVMPTPHQVVSWLPEFKTRLADLRHSWKGEPPWVDVVELAIDIARSKVSEWTLTEAEI